MKFALNRFIHNNGSVGGAICGFYETSLILRDSHFIENMATKGNKIGAAIYLYEASTLDIYVNLPKFYSLYLIFSGMHL
jgi:hypothetical protein